LGHGSTFDRPNSLPAQGEVQESQSPGTSQAPSLRDLVSNPRRKDLGLEFESEISEFSRPLRSQSRDLLEISILRPSRDLSFETFSKSQFRDLLEISVPRPSRSQFREIETSKSQFRDLLEISISRPSRNLSSETFSISVPRSQSQFRDLLDLNPETFSKSQFRDLLEISVSRPSRDLSSETFSRSQQEFKIQMPTTKSYLDPRRSRDG
jgi:hypothetical protein